MFKGIFNAFSKNEDPQAAPLPEERWIPSMGSSLTPPNEFWVTTQVFVDKKQKGLRVYYAFVHKADSSTTKSVYKCSYRIGKGNGDANVEAYEPDFRSAVSSLARLEKQMREQPQLFEAVPELRGNFRDLASLQKLHFDDNGNCIPIGKKTLVASEALFKRETLDALYGEEKKESAEMPSILTWDDFYRDVVNKKGALSKADLQKIVTDGWSEESRVCQKFIRDSHEMMRVLKELHQTILDGSAPSKKSIVFPNPQFPMTDPDLARSAVYQYRVMALTSLLRAGGELYQKFTSTIPADPQVIGILASLGKSAHSIACNQLDFPARVADDIVNIITQGPDPYAGKPLPLEEALERYSAGSSQPAPKKKPPQDYSP